MSQSLGHDRAVFDRQRGSCPRVSIVLQGQAERGWLPCQWLAWLVRDALGKAAFQPSLRNLELRASTAAGYNSL